MSYDNQQWQPPPMGGGYPPPPGPSGYGATTTAAVGNELFTGALITGICSVVFPLLGIVLLATLRSTMSIGLAKLGSIFFFLTFIVGIVAICLGIVSVSLAGHDSGRKAKGVVGLCLGILPFAVMVILALVSESRMPGVPY
jgi:hypothetical protein